MDFENLTEIEKIYIDKGCDFIKLYTDQKTNPNLESNYDSDFCCSNCQKIYKYSEVKDLKFKFHCEKCQEKASENVERLKKILEAEQKEQQEKKQQEKEQQKEKEDCDNDKCIYANHEKKLYDIGNYEFCADCFYAIGRHIAKYGL